MARAYVLKFKTPSLYFETFATCNEVREIAKYFEVSVVFEGLQEEGNIISISDCTSNMLVFNETNQSVVRDTDLVEGTIYKIKYDSFFGGYVLSGITCGTLPIATSEQTPVATVEKDIVKELKIKKKGDV